MSVNRDEDLGTSTIPSAHYIKDSPPVYQLPLFVIPSKMPSKAAKDKLTERLEDQPPFNDPHHRTTRPRRSALKLGSDSGLDPLPIRSQGASPTRSGRSRPTRAYSPRPGTRRSSTSHAVQRSDFERASRAPRRTLSQDIPTRPRRTSGMSPGGHREKRSLSRERRTSKSHRRINNINQIEVQQGFNQTQVRNNHGLKAGAAPRATGPHSISSRNPTSWPEMVHISPSELPSGSSLPAVDVEHIQQRHRYLQHYKNVLEINALHALLSEQVAPLNPVLAVPPPSYRLFGFGTWLERKLENSNWMLNRRAQANALPGLEWDVRTGPEEATISAWPYTTLSCTSNGQFPSKKEMKTRGALDDAELRRFYGQTVTNPPSSVSTEVAMRKLHVNKLSVCRYSHIWYLEYSCEKWCTWGMGLCL